MKERIGSKKVLSILCCVMFLVILGVSTGLQGKKSGTGENIFEKENIQSDRDSSQERNNVENSFTEEGTTSMGMISQMPEIALNRVLMYVEEVYVETGATVQEGDALFKIAEECMEDAKTYYKSAIVSAEDSLTEAKLAYESGELEASYLKEETLRSQQYDPAVHNAAFTYFDSNNVQQTITVRNEDDFLEFKTYKLAEHKRNQETRKNTLKSTVNPTTGKAKEVEYKDNNYCSGAEVYCAYSKTTDRYYMFVIPSYHEYNIVLWKRYLMP